ncbi:hypothetical protein MmiEs2_16290 [Methanimicrococcus stummii]|uniref:Uncharacterized protein n=1 Tax=Methanimicrococcus stummii TaxID=3028294 RepID=A0AA96VNM5_9EURY|nr:hypothetical protein [Methanimicrococcus sp. Es2]WNY29402.1 hypothetical protein MmiEs2_16290 [Methanimicrococcus sp. Es2]
MDLFLTFGLLITLISGIYYAQKENFFVVFSKKYNQFPVRLILTVPIFSGVCFGLSLGLYILIILLVPTDLIELIVSTFTPYIGLTLPIISNIIIIITTDKYVIGQKETKENLDKTDLFIYLPIHQYRNFGGKLYGTKFEYPTRIKGDLVFGVQKTDLIIDERELKGIDFAYTFNGEIVVSKEILQILNDFNLTGFKTRPIQNTNGSVNNNYLQIITTHIMPKVSDETKMVYEQWIHASKIVINTEIYYDKKVLSETLDFNQTLETFGSEGYAFTPPTKYWIVSKKARSVLIDELKQNEFDFIPIHLIDEKD